MYRAESAARLPKEAQALRQAVFMDEQGFSYEFDETDNTATHLTLYDDAGKAAACCRVFPEGDGVWHVGRVAVRRDCRGQGLGLMIMQEAEAEVRRQGGAKLALSAQEQAAGFYGKLGYVQAGEPYLDEHCPHVRMEKALGGR